MSEGPERFVSLKEYENLQQVNSNLQRDIDSLRGTVSQLQQDLALWDNNEATALLRDIWQSNALLAKAQEEYAQRSEEIGKKLKAKFL